MSTHHATAPAPQQCRWGLKCRFLAKGKCRNIHITQPLNPVVQMAPAPEPSFDTSKEDDEKDFASFVDDVEMANEFNALCLNVPDGMSAENFLSANGLDVVQIPIDEDPVEGLVCGRFLGWFCAPQPKEKECGCKCELLHAMPSHVVD